MSLFLFFLFLEICLGVRLRRGIDSVTAPSQPVSVDASGKFVASDLPFPGGAAAPTETTTPSPFSTYSAAWDATYRFNFANPTFSIDTGLISGFSVANMGPNFAVINTAQPVYPNQYR
jgi:hypothetical protein